MIKFIKAFYKTVKQIGKHAEYFLHTISSFVGYVIFNGIYEITKSKYIEYITIGLFMLGIYFLCRLLYITLKNDLKEFFMKVKNNIK